MWTFLRLRSQQTVADLVRVLEDMALLDTRPYRALTTPDIGAYASTASTPSFRARSPDIMAPRESTVRESIMRESITGDGDGGNVKVVVRVRKFIKRGHSLAHD